MAMQDRSGLAEQARHSVENEAASLAREQVSAFRGGARCGRRAVRPAGRSVLEADALPLTTACQRGAVEFLVIVNVNNPWNP